METISSVLVVQTAFLGDVILTLPLARAVRKGYPLARVDVVTIPSASGVLADHPDIAEVLVFDKRGKDAGLAGLIRMASLLRRRNYDLALVPHRSLRSALLVRLASIPRRVGFDRSQGKWFLTNVVRYDPDIHEISRNLGLLSSLGVPALCPPPPHLIPPDAIRNSVDGHLKSVFGDSMPPLIAIAPGTAWKTKQWLPERFAEVAGRLAREGFGVVLIGGLEDARLCEGIAGSGSAGVRSFAGKLSHLGSAELLRRCRLLITNDSAPLHLAEAVGTRVVAIFGATIPEFGFGPYNDGGEVLQIHGLGCRPCSIHGGNRCPIRTFDCMTGIGVDIVVETALGQARTEMKPTEG